MNLENLKQARKKSGLTQKEVADSIGVGQSTYKNYECGFREPNGDTTVALAKLFGVTTDYLLGLEPAPNPFAELGLDETSEQEMLAQYMSFPPYARAMLMDILVKLADSVRQEQAQAERPPTPDDYIFEETVAGMERVEHIAQEAAERRAEEAAKRQDAG